MNSTKNKRLFFTTEVSAPWPKALPIAGHIREGDRQPHSSLFMQHQGVQVKAHSNRTIAEELPDAYKNVETVVQAVEEAGLANRVARLKPHLVVKVAFIKPRVSKDIWLPLFMCKKAHHAKPQLRN